MVKDRFITIRLCQKPAVSTMEQPRKRQRLDHLSIEEKLHRRKMRNREAAQLARDKKKAYVDQLEEVVRQLTQANKDLQARVAALEKETDQLRSENITLNARLDEGCRSNTIKSEAIAELMPVEGSLIKSETILEPMPVEVVLGSSDEAVDTVVPNTPVEPAEPISFPQQRDQGVVWIIATMLSLILLRTFLLMEQTYRYKDSKNCTSSFFKSIVSHLDNHPQKNVLMKWWGRHQKSWTPAIDLSIQILSHHCQTTLIPFHQN